MLMEQTGLILPAIWQADSAQVEAALAAAADEKHIAKPAEAKLAVAFPFGISDAAGELREW